MDNHHSWDCCCWNPVCKVVEVDSIIVSWLKALFSNFPELVEAFIGVLMPFLSIVMLVMVAVVVVRIIKAIKGE